MRLRRLCGRRRFLRVWADPSRLVEQRSWCPRSLMIMCSKDGLVLVTYQGRRTLLVSGRGLGLGAAASTGDGQYVGEVLAATLAYAPAL